MSAQELCANCRHARVSYKNKLGEWHKMRMAWL
jgi:hypothetical protein